MEEILMAREVPQEELFNKSEQYAKYSNWLFWISFCSTISFQLTNTLTQEIMYFNEFKVGVNLVLLILIFFLDYKNNFFKESAEDIRRKGLIDNSYGTKYCDKDSDEYYDNEEIDEGLYKLLINLFENSFYTKESLNKMLECSSIKVGLLLLILIVFAVFGFKSCAISTSVLQLFLSKKY